MLAGFGFPSFGVSRSVSALRPEVLRVAFDEAGFSSGDANFDLLVDTFANTYLLLAYGRLDVSDKTLYGQQLWLAGEQPLAQIERFARWMQGF